MSTYETKQLMN